MKFEIQVIRHKKTGRKGPVQFNFFKMITYDHLIKYNPFWSLP